MTGNPFGIADCKTTATCTALLKKNIVNYVHASSFKERHSQQWHLQKKSQFLQCVQKTKLLATRFPLNKLHKTIEINCKEVSTCCSTGMHKGAFLSLLMSLYCEIDIFKEIGIVMEIFFLLQGLEFHSFTVWFIFDCQLSETFSYYLSVIALFTGLTSSYFILGMVDKNLC